MAALWTEACLIFPALDALNDGYEVYPEINALGVPLWSRTVRRWTAHRLRGHSSELPLHVRKYRGEVHFLSLHYSLTEPLQLPYITIVDKIVKSFISTENFSYRRS